MEEFLMCARECAGDSGLVYMALIGAHMLFSMWASTLKKEKWWEVAAHVISFNWGYLMQNKKLPPAPEPEA